MKLQHLTSSSDDLCILCQMAEVAPDREDGLCEECASVSESYGSNLDLEELEDKWDL